MSTSCCQVAPAGTVAGRADCPACGQRGRRVKPITLSSLLRTGAPPATGRFRFCGTPGCGVAYFSEDSAATVPVEAVAVRIGQKELAPDRPICYCFGYSAADIAADPEGVPATITERCRRGEDRCPETNPQGACCLGQVRAVARAADRDCCG